jgi:hypothetical protein
MGGFMAFWGNQPSRPVLPNELWEYSFTGNGHFPRITVEEIWDKSKDNFMLKVLVVLQTGWFIAQCIARGAQHLPLTELEVMTIAFVAVNLVIYGLWWNKPLNVERGIRVYNPSGAAKEAVERQDQGQEGQAGFSRSTTFIGDEIVSPFQRFSQIIGYKPRTAGFRDQRRVGTFYSGDPKWVDLWPLISVLVVPSLTVAAFGAIHCIAWGFAFPSTTQRTLWRVASIVVTGAPIVLILIWIAWAAVYFTLRAWSLHGTRSDTVMSVVVMIASFVILVPVYLAARLTLLVLPFLSLKTLPPGAYRSVRWTEFIPHL